MATELPVQVQRLVAFRLLLAAVLALLCWSSVDARVSAAEHTASQVRARAVSLIPSL